MQEWTEDADDKLRDIITSGGSLRHAAEVLGRRYSAVRKRTADLGLRARDDFGEGPAGTPALAVRRLTEDPTITALAERLEVDPTTMGLYLKGLQIHGYDRVTAWTVQERLMFLVTREGWVAEKDTARGRLRMVRDLAQEGAADLRAWLDQQDPENVSQDYRAIAETLEEIVKVSSDLLQVLGDGEHR